MSEEKDDECAPWRKTYHGEGRFDVGLVVRVRSQERFVDELGARRGGWVSRESGEGVG